MHVLEALLARGPDCIAIANDAGELPLHAAAMHCRNVYIVRMLAEGGAAGAHMVSNHSGCLPLHLAAWKNRSAAVVGELARCCPDAAMHEDNYGMLPLHYAACGNGLEVVEELYDAFPAGCISRSKHGRFPHEMADTKGPVYALLFEAHRSGGTRRLAPHHPATAIDRAAAQAAADESATRSAGAEFKPGRSSFKVSRPTQAARSSVSFG